MPIDHALAVFWVETILNEGACVAQIEHELARSTDYFVGALSDDRHFSNRCHISKLRIVFVILAQSFQLFEVVFDIADH